MMRMRGNSPNLSSMKVKSRFVRNTDDRVRFIANNIRSGIRSPKVHAFASIALTDFCDGNWCVPPRDWIGEVCAITNFIRDNVRYTLDPYEVDTYRTPDRTIELAMGDCDDITALAGAVLHAVGYPVWIKVIQMTGQSDFHHIYIMVGLPPQSPERVMAVDPSQPFPCGWEPEVQRAKVYEVR